MLLRYRGGKVRNFGSCNPTCNMVGMVLRALNLMVKVADS